MLNLAQTLASSRRQLDRIDSEEAENDVVSPDGDRLSIMDQSSTSEDEDDDYDDAPERLDEKASIDSARRSERGSLKQGFASALSFKGLRMFRENETQTSSSSLHKHASKPSLLAHPKLSDGSVLNLHRLAVEHHHFGGRRFSQSQMSRLSFDCTPYSSRHARRMSRQRPSVADQHRAPSDEVWSPGRVSVSTNPHEKDHLTDVEYGPEGNPSNERKVYFPKVIRLCMTTTVLILLLILYCLVSTFIMQALEEDKVTVEGNCPPSKQVNRSGLVVDLFLTRLSQLSETLGDNSTRRQVSWPSMREALTSAKLINEIGEILDNETKCEDETILEKWNFQKSAMFVLTVVTTIGYGHYSPKSQIGRFVTMVIALFGIPLTVVAVAELASLFTHSTKLFIRFLRHCGRTEAMRSGKKRMRTAVIMQIWMAFLLIPAYILITAVLYQQIEGWSYFDSVYFTFITYSTIGFGDMTPGSNASEAATVYGNLIVLLGVGLYAMLIQTIGTKYMRVQLAVHRCVRRLDRNLLEHARATVKHHTSRLVKEDSRSAEETEPEPE